MLEENKTREELIFELDELRRRELKYRRIVEMAREGIWSFDMNLKTTFVNPCMAEMLGYTVDEMLGRPLFDFMDDEGKKIINANIINRIIIGVKGAQEFEIIKKDGTRIYVMVDATPITDSNGCYTGMIAFVTDITSRKSTEEALRESEEKFRALADFSNTGIILIQGEDTVYINQALASMGGYTIDECMRMKFWEVAPPGIREYIRERGSLRQRGEPGPSRNELKLVRKNGDYVWLDCTASVLNYRKKPAILLTALDITDRKNAEEALIAAKAEAELYIDLMGHDINNMNQIIMGFLEMALDIMEKEGKLGMENRGLLDKAIESVGNSSRLIDNVRKLQHEKMGFYKREVMNIDKLLESVVGMFKNTSGRDITISYTCVNDCRVEANELLRDVFINLIGNAIKHSRNSLTLNISIVRTSDNGKSYCKIIVEDDGPGIPDDVKVSIFNRFSLDNTRAKGKGFGLCLIKHLVDDYNGKLFVEDRIKGDHTKGCRFIVMLPTVEI